MFSDSVIFQKINRRFSTVKYIFYRLFTSRNYRWKFWFSQVKPRLARRSFISKMPIDIVILAIEKDLETLPYVIEGVRRNINHPVSNIYIVSPLLNKIQKLCSASGCVFVDEKLVLDLDPDSLNKIIQLEDRSKWYYQQFLKWSGDKFSSETHYLVVDADTVFIRPQSFEKNGKVIFNFSDEYHQPYFDHYKRILGETVKCPVSFTSHQMLFENAKLKELKKKIEDINCCIWYEAILKNLDINVVSGSSDYDTYGQYVFSHYRSSIMLEYWFNKSLKRKYLQNLDQLEHLYRDKYKSISFHSWNK